MLDLIQENESLIWALGIFSVVSFFATLGFIPWIVARLPRDYFARPTRDSFVSQKMPLAVRWAILIIKNLAGLVLVALGIVMLVIPGQGVLTIVIGLILIDFPGKYRLERSLVQRKPVLRSVNWLRKRSNKAPLEFSDEQEAH